VALAAFYFMENRTVEKYEKRVKTRKKLSTVGLVLRIVVISAVLALAVLAVLNYDQLTPEAIRARFSDTEELGTSVGSFSFIADNKNSFAVRGQGIDILSPSGLVMIDGTGEERVLRIRSFSRPVAKAAGNYLLAYDVGGTNIIYSEGYSILREETLASVVISGAVSESGNYLLITEERGAKAVATVYGTDSAERFKWVSSERYLVCGALADDGKMLALAGIRREGTRVVSSIAILVTTSDAPVAVVDMLDDVVIELMFVGENIVAITERGILFFDGKGKQLGSYEYGVYDLSEFDSGSDFVAIRLTAPSIGDLSRISTFSVEGAKLGEFGIGNVSAISCTENELGILTTDSLMVYNNTLGKKAEMPVPGGSKSLLLRKDGEALVVTSGTAVIYSY